MNNEKGITLISLTIYIISMLIVISIISVITTYFYKNVNIDTSNIDISNQFTKFNSFFTKEINEENIKIQEINNNYIVFDNGIQYTYIDKNKSIYRNNVRIVTNIDKVTFEKINNADKTQINITMKINNEEKQTTYYLK